MIHRSLLHASEDAVLRAVSMHGRFECSWKVHGRIHLVQSNAV